MRGGRKFLVGHLELGDADRRVPSGSEWAGRRAPARRLSRTDNFGLAKHLVNSTGRLFAFADGVNDFAAAVGAIAAAENIREAGGTGCEVARDRPVSIQLEL